MTRIKNYEIRRAIFHIGSSLILIWVLDYVKPFLFAPWLFAFVLFVELLRLKYPKLNKLIMHQRSFFSRIIRREEVDNLSAVLAMVFAFLLISWMPLNIIKVALLVNGLADPAARFFGIHWGKKKILKTQNSWVGSSAFFLVALIIGLVYFNWWIALIIAVIGSIAEFLPDTPPLWVDNFRIPFFVGLFLWLLI